MRSLPEWVSLTAILFAGDGVYGVTRLKRVLNDDDVGVTCYSVSSPSGRAFLD